MRRAASALLFATIVALATGLTGAASSVALAAGPPDPKTLLTVSATTRSVAGAAGHATLRVEAKLAAGWHVNSSVEKRVSLFSRASPIQVRPQSTNS